MISSAQSTNLKISAPQSKHAMPSLTINPVSPSPSLMTKASVKTANSSSLNHSTMTVSSTDKQQDVKESVDRMKANLSRFARVSNKKMALRTLLDCSFLRNIPLDTTPAPPAQREDWPILEEEVCMTNVQLNGLLFTGSPSNQILKVLRALCQELCKGLRVSSETIYGEAIVRLANSSNSADSYFSLNALLGSQDLVLKPLRESQLKGKHKLEQEHPPTDLAIYEANGQIHAVSTEYTTYGLFRRSDAVKSGKPWIALTAQVHERVNLTTGDSVRQVRTQITTPDV